MVSIELDNMNDVIVVVGPVVVVGDPAVVPSVATLALPVVVPPAFPVAVAPPLVVCTVVATVVAMLAVLYQAP